MPAHVIYSRVDHLPAGFSPRWLKEILRERLGFTGAVMTDDLGMAAARQIDGSPLSFLDAALLALDAGCDLVLLCNQSPARGEVIDEMLEGLVQAAQDGRWQPDPDSEQRRQRLLPQTDPLPWDELMRDPVYQRALERLA